MNNNALLAGQKPSIARNDEWNVQDLKTTNEIQVMTQRLKRLSSHQHVWYGYQLDQNHIVFKHSSSELIYNIKDSSLQLNQLQAQKKLSILELEFKDIVKSILFSMQCMPMSACLLKMQYQPNQTLYFLLFSEHKHSVNDYIWQELNFYIEQQEKYFLLKHENKNINARLNELEEINEGRSKYFAMIAHDLRAPFHGIMGCADILLHEADTLDDESGNRLLQYVYDTSNSTYALLEGLLNWSMARGGSFHLNQSHFRVDDVVQEVLDLLFASAYKKQISLHSDIELGLFVYADIHMVTSILQNLVSNALKFTPGQNQRKISLSAHAIDEQVEIVIQDNGVGMTVAQIDRLFQGNTNPSTQGTAGEKGMGLGLSLCKNFLALNNGSMTVSSVIDEGTCFKIYLPLGDKHA